MRAVFILCSLATLLYLVSCCEQKHYLKDGKCCKMCGPGKRMLVNDNCEDPRCQDCQDGEYQSEYTSKTRCERQRSCDTNLHFDPQMNPSKTSLIKCECKPGYFCTQEDDCDTCWEHTVCKPGQRVIQKGTSLSDTVCKACENGSFSTHDSAETCKKWTICENGYENAPGSSTSDRICENGKPIHRAEIGVGVAVALLILIAVAVVFYCTKKNNGWKELTKKAQNIQGVKITKLDQDADAERGLQPLYRQPEEDDDNSIPVSPTLSNVTENGLPVQQEHGKDAVSSSPETNSVL